MPIDSQNRSMFTRFAPPHTFGPDLSLGEALVAVGGCLARIFGGCALFAVWGGIAVYAWSAIGNRFWRVTAEGPLLLLFLAVLAGMMAGVSAVERSVLRDR